MKNSTLTNLSNYHFSDINLDIFVEVPYDFPEFDAEVKLIWQPAHEKKKMYI